MSVIYFVAFAKGSWFGKAEGLLWGKKKIIMKRSLMVPPLCQINKMLVLLQDVWCVSVSQSWRLMPGSLVPYAPKETWQRTRRICWANSLKYSGRSPSQSLILNDFTSDFQIWKSKVSVKYLVLSSQHLHRASSCRSPQGCQRWTPHHHCISVSA